MRINIMNYPAWLGARYNTTMSMSASKTCPVEDISTWNAVS